MEPLPTRPDPAIRAIWFWRGVGLFLLLAPFLGWPILWPIAVGLETAGFDAPVAFAAGAVAITAGALVAVWVWTRLAYGGFSFDLERDEVRIRKGVLLVSTVHVPYAGIDTVTVRRGPLLRRRLLGTLRLRLAGARVLGFETGAVSLPGVREPEGLAAALLERIRRSRPETRPAEP